MKTTSPAPGRVETSSEAVANSKRTSTACFQLPLRYPLVFLAGCKVQSQWDQNESRCVRIGDHIWVNWRQACPVCDCRRSRESGFFTCDARSSSTHDLHVHCSTRSNGRASHY